MKPIKFKDLPRFSFTTRHSERMGVYPRIKKHHGGLISTSKVYRQETRNGASEVIQTCDVWELLSSHDHVPLWKSVNKNKEQKQNYMYIVIEDRWCIMSWTLIRFNHNYHGLTWSKLPTRRFAWPDGWRFKMAGQTVDAAFLNSCQTSIQYTKVYQFNTGKVLKTMEE